MNILPKEKEKETEEQEEEEWITHIIIAFFFLWDIIIAINRVGSGIKGWFL